MAFVQYIAATPPPHEAINPTRTSIPIVFGISTASSPIWNRSRKLSLISKTLSRSAHKDRFPRRHFQRLQIVCAAASPAGSSSSSNDVNPYEVLGVSPMEGFDMIKTAYTRKRKEAERRGDEATASQLERAYDKIMMAQLTNRKKGMTFGSFEVSKDIKYADKQPIVPWGPRFTKSSAQDTRINMGIAALFSIWIVIKQSAEWKPLQFLAFVFVYRIFEKLKANEAQVSSTFSEEGEDEGRGLRMGKRLLRSLCLVFGSIAVASLGFTVVLNALEFLLKYIPVFVYNNQEGQSLSHERLPVFSYFYGFQPF